MHCTLTIYHVLLPIDMKPIRAGMGHEARMADVGGGGGGGMSYCTKCNYTNQHRGKVKRHMMTHLDSPKVWVCSVCKRRFAEGHHLRRHMATRGHVRRRSVQPMTPRVVRSKSVQKKKLEASKEADKEVEKLKKLLKKRIEKKINSIEQEIVNQYDQIQKGRKQMESLLAKLKLLEAEKNNV